MDAKVVCTRCNIQNVHVQILTYSAIAAIFPSSVVGSGPAAPRVERFAGDNSPAADIKLCIVCSGPATSGVERFAGDDSPAADIKLCIVCSGPAAPRVERLA